VIRYDEEEKEKKNVTSTRAKTTIMMPTDKPGSSSTGGARAKGSRMAAADTSTPLTPTSSVATSTSRTTAPVASSSGTQPLHHPAVLNTLRDPSHYEELSVIGNGEWNRFNFAKCVNE
jgi:hypothetical protein